MSEIKTGPAEFLETANSLIPEVREYLQEQEQDLGGIWHGQMIFAFLENQITSPPEQLFYAAWHTIYPIPFGPGLRAFISLHPQVWVEKYRIDFAVYPIEHFRQLQSFWLGEMPLRDLDRLLPRYAIEIDGKWHESSYDQIEQDKQRERIITGRGYSVIRFTAREIFRDPNKCVESVQKIFTGSLLQLTARISRTLSEYDLRF